MKFISFLYLIAACGAGFVSCKGSTDSSSQPFVGSQVDLRGVWVEDTTDRLHGYVNSPLATLTITTNAKGTIGTAFYPAVGKSYPIVLIGMDSSWELHWGPDPDFGSPIVTCGMYYNFPNISLHGSDSILTGTLQYWYSYSGGYAGGIDAEMTFTKRK